MNSAPVATIDVNGAIVEAGCPLCVRAIRGARANPQSPINSVMDVATEGSVLACANARITPFDASVASIALAPDSCETRQSLPVPTVITQTMASVWSLGPPPVIARGIRHRLVSAKIRPAVAV
jgi:hypothetical protein